MRLREEKTKWVLFLSSSGEPEDRHVMDLAFGLHSLISSGIKVSDIEIYVDGTDRGLVRQLLSNATNQGFALKESKEFFCEQENNSHENIVMFVTGHGSIHGIDASSPIKPHSLLQCIKNAPSVKQAVVYLGQCYAGVFNYIGAGRGKGGGSRSEVDTNVVLIGATNLHESLSSSTQETLATGPLNWVANLFLLHVFKWISCPFDVDGDGLTTVMDSYKYAGVMSNGANKGIKINSFVRSIDLHQAWIAANKEYETYKTLNNKLKLQAAQAQYEEELSVRYTHQECWILNAIPAQSIEV
ncbi:hypothetical protein HLV40_06480 [Chromohalobacter salexigens]|nr:hypothetical protein [Chromohalobacter salexigens]